MAVKISGFSFVHNALTGGYPVKEAITAVKPYVDEVVVVDMRSDDGTNELLGWLGVKVLNHQWATEEWRGDGVLVSAFNRHVDCEGDVIVMFEADEIYSDSLIREVVDRIKAGASDLAVYRLQLEQNFQRCRWYPIPVHRIFPKGGGSYHLHPTNCPEGVQVVGPEHGYMWDVANCFRDDWLNRKHQQTDLWGRPRALMVPEHFTHKVELSEAEEQARFNEAHWTWQRSPFDIPDVLKPLVGRTKYHDR